MSRNTETEDKRLIATVVWFANARLRSAAQVERRFAKAAGSPVFKVIPPDQLWAYQQDQQHARDMLVQALRFDRMSAAERQAFADSVRDTVIQKVNVKPAPTYSRGRFRLEWETLISGVEAAVAYAIALLLSSPREKLRRRLGICAYEECGNGNGKFFFDQRPRGGTKMAYCSRAHSDIDRVRRHRRLKKAKGKAR